MKRKALYIFIIVAIVTFLYLFADLSAGGVFREYLVNQFFYVEEYVDADGILHQTMMPFWLNIKLMLYVLILFTICVCYIIIQLLVRRKTAKQSEEIKHVIETFLRRFCDDAEIVLPKGYQGIEALLLQIRVKEEKQVSLLEKQTQQKHDLISYLAHDMKTPLASVIGYLHLLNDVQDVPARQREAYIRITLEKAQRLEQLIDEFFDITRFNLHDIVISRGRIQMDFLLEQLREQFYPQLLAQHKTLRLCVEQGTTYYGDAEKLARAFNNILKNAISYSYPNTEITIQVEQNETEMLLSFHNQGDEIPQQKLAMIFEKFYRLDKARSTNSGGAGLGLAIAKEIIEAHKGKIYAESNVQETVFYVKLPISVKESEYSNGCEEIAS